MKSDEIIDTIKSGGTKMRPRWYFVARALLVAIVAILLFSIILFVATFIIFALQENGGFFATNFGPGGWSVFLQSLPWSLLLLSLALILTLWILLRRYPVIYHQPFLYMLLILIVVISLACLFVSASVIHGGIFRYVSRNQVPMVTGVYEFETAPAGGVYRGQIMTMVPGGFILGNALGQTSTVLMTSEASSELNDVDSGDYIILFGHGVATATIEASGLEKIVDYR